MEMALKYEVTNAHMDGEVTQMPVKGTCGHVQNANTNGEIRDVLKGVQSGNIRNFDMFHVNMVIKGTTSDNKEKEYFL
jgi:hypothetical protein